MRAMALAAPPTPLRETDLLLPAPGAGQVQIRVHACGVSRTDLHVVAEVESRSPSPATRGSVVSDSTWSNGLAALRVPSPVRYSAAAGRSVGA
jgi:NADPH:quinone reductase-like Zn-dependent oxidoreductase